LLVDADLRRPRLHKLFAKTATVGLAAVVAGRVEWREAVQESGVANLSLLPCGPLPPNPSELLTSPRFAELLETVRKEFDFVIVDTPPLLAVTDPCVVAPRVDGVVLTIRLSKKSGPQAERAREMLTALNVKVIGVVVNGVNRRDGAGRYSTGQYEYSYNPTDYAAEAEDREGNYYEADEESPNGNGHASPPPTAPPKPASNGGLSGLVNRVRDWWR
jgi:capsular exopolysaccharide synthesis family protein